MKLCLIYKIIWGTVYITVIWNSPTSEHDIPLSIYLHFMGFFLFKTIWTITKIATEKKGNHNKTAHNNQWAIATPLCPCQLENDSIRFVTTSKAKTKGMEHNKCPVEKDINSSKTSDVKMF